MAAEGRLYQAKDFNRLLGTPGFSDTLLKNHFALYEGYVKSVNNLLGKNVELESRRRFGWEFNGMRFHEYYFENMKKGGSGLSKTSKLYKKLVQDFGSYENWEKDFKAVGGQRGIGWAALYYDSAGNRLINAWINEHDTGSPATCQLILIMDVFEHAFMTDYGLKRAGYIESFFNAIHWEEAQNRYPRFPL